MIHFSEILEVLFATFITGMAFMVLIQYRIKSWLTTSKEKDIT